MSLFKTEKKENLDQKEIDEKPETAYVNLFLRNGGTFKWDISNDDELVRGIATQIIKQYLTYNSAIIELQRLDTLSTEEILYIYNTFDRDSVYKKLGVYINTRETIGTIINDLLIDDKDLKLYGKLLDAMLGSDKVKLYKILNDLLKLNWHLIEYNNIKHKGYFCYLKNGNLKSSLTVREKTSYYGNDVPMIKIDFKNFQLETDEPINIFDLKAIVEDLEEFKENGGI